MEILLTGNTEYITPEWIDTAFPEDHVIVTRRSGDKSRDKRLHTVTLRDNMLLKQLNETYEFDRVIYFSEYLTPHTDDDSGPGRLRRLLQALLESEVRMVYLSPPECAGTARTGKALLAKAAEELCMHYAQSSGIKVKILRTPYLYAQNLAEAGSFFNQIFKGMDKGSVRFDEQPGQQAAFLCMDDLAELINRVFDSWTDDNEIWQIPDVFGADFEIASRNL